MNRSNGLKEQLKSNRILLGPRLFASYPLHQRGLADGNGNFELSLDS